MSSVLDKINTFVRGDLGDEQEFLYFWDDIDAQQVKEEATTTSGVGFFSKYRVFILFFIDFITLPILVLSNSDIIKGITALVAAVSLLVTMVMILDTYKRPMDFLEKEMALMSDLRFRKHEEMRIEDYQQIIQSVDEMRNQLVAIFEGTDEEMTHVATGLVSIDNNVISIQHVLEDVRYDFRDSIANVTSYQETRGYVDLTSKGIDALTDAFDEALNGMDDVSKTLRSIGNQIKMLALNAGIEAAKAPGEFGIGFEVVSANLRRLASHAIRTTNNVKEISKEIAKNARIALDGISSSMGNLNTRIDHNYDNISRIERRVMDIHAYLDNTKSNLASINNGFNEIKGLNDRIVLD